MPAITLLPTLCFSFSLFSFSRFCYSAFPTLFFFFFSSCSCGVVEMVVLWYCDSLVVIVAVMMIILCMAGAPYILLAVTGFFTISPFNHFCLGVGVLLDHPLVCQLPQPFTCAGCAASHYQTKNSILFACSPWHSHLEQGGHSPSLSLMRCT